MSSLRTSLRSLGSSEGLLHRTVSSLWWKPMVLGSCQLKGREWKEEEGSYVATDWIAMIL